MLCILCLIMELSNNLRLKIVPLSDSNLLFFLINFICSFSGLKKALSQSEGSFPSFRQSSFVLFEINPISFSGVISCGYSSVSKEVITWSKKPSCPMGQDIHSHAQGTQSFHELGRGWGDTQDAFGGLPRWDDSSCLWPQTVFLNSPRLRF